MSDRGTDWLARRMSALRAERGLSRAELAAASGLEPEDIDAIEAGEGSAGLTALRALAKGFGMQLSELFQGFDGPDEGFSLGARVRACRRAQKRTLEELAAAVGLERKQLEEIETDQYPLELAEIRALASALGKSVADLLGKG